MSFGNNRPPQQHFYNGQPQNYVTWSQQTNNIFNFSSQFNPLNPLLPPVFSPNLLFQLQNNYFNSTAPSHSLIAPNTHSQILSRNCNSYASWLPQPTLVKKLNLCRQKQKRNQEVICLDQESHSDVVIIDDSQQNEPTSVLSKKDDKLKSEIGNTEFSLKLDRQIKQKDYSYEVKKSEYYISQKRQIRNAKYCTITEINKKQTDSKLLKKKIIIKDRYIYKLTPHEKHLNELSQYRQYFPHQTVTGPQFQAILPPSGLLGNSSGGLREANSWLDLCRQRLLSRLQ